MKTFGFHSEARAEFQEAAFYYESQQEGLGRRFVDAVWEAAQKVIDRPLLYREIEPGIRQCRVPRFPFGVIYRLKEETIEILAVMHLRRKPGYWKSRKKRH
ncbi:MAG: type II toxin-antitoxin system RelE/ParE family toxin [Planctomycetes bacterium]|nr:type II toxin-antitoxin system RelE/ParE family toxin [Planctomycetota bacterium]